MSDFGGGMISSLSSVKMRATSVLFSASPGTIAMSPDFAGLIAASRTSSRNPAFWFALSGPWHAKQLSERMGRMSRL